MIHIFHGFLGSPVDFSFLQRDGVVLHDLYEEKDFHIEEGDILIGYSMGGRIALELAAKMNFNIKKLILLNAHPGPESEEERLERKIFEQKVLQELRTKTRTEFLTWWNALPIFTHDIPLSTSQERFDQSPELFERYRLSEQKNFLPEMIRNSEKILYVVGLYDEKYMELATELLLSQDLRVKGIPAGHRIYQNRDELLKLLEEENIL